MTRTADWTLADVVDFEHFLARADPEDDRLRFEAEVAPGLAPGARRDRRAVLRAWLELQRGRQGGRPTPGTGLRAALSWLARLAWLSGGVAGVALSGAWFATATHEPVNAVLFWVAVVGLQLLLLVLALLGWLRWRRRGTGGALQGLWRALLLRLDAGLRRAPGEERDALRAALGRIALRREHYGGTLLAAPLVALMQRFAVAFNLGLLVAMLALHLPLADLRFGWQSTYPISAPQMHRAVQWAATPWRWLLPQAQPGADEVAATRYGRGQPAHTLPEAAARSWWPFLALSVACYGLLLRLALWGGVELGLRRRLRALRFDHPEAGALWRRLAGPLVDSSGGVERLPQGEAAAPGAQPRPGARCAVLVAQELPLGDAALAERLRRHFGWEIDALHRVPVDDRGALEALREPLLRQRPQALAVVVESGRDPIVAVARFLRAVLGLAGDAEVRVLLVPEPQAAAEREGGDEARLAIWRRFGQIQHLALEIERLP
ncbi:DUF2868 domain-containing protein [Caldimonas tepidiphila]|uniref:DUF2868 domain-containing protein n=1 Tax=Caldimonas tepidiphila TaxID=2315841 RepID=UPI000E5C143D|nr:DUF2868 domain-containing protein [Caldimonas tepidiphila]